MTKTEIVDAAFKVWGRNFYRKTSLSKLADELGVSKPALYRHFASKQALTSAMTEHFLDDFAASNIEDFRKALTLNDPDEGIIAIVESISFYFARNVYSLIFCLINIQNRDNLKEALKSRGADIGILQLIINKKYTYEPELTRIIFATLTFFMSHFHKKNKSMENIPADKQIQEITSIINETVKYGLGFSPQKTDINFENLEEQVNEIPLNAEAEPFFKAVAEAVAEAGPWDVSMDMVAKKLGLSKSSLYGRFKNKKDMLRRLFLTEFKRIIEFARQGISLSKDASQQLYLGIYSISVYLRSRHEILVAMNWIRTRKLDIGKPEKQEEIFRLFEDVNIESLHNAADEEKQRTSHWILFLLINVLCNPDKTAQVEQNSLIRMLYKFVIRGLGGFTR
ncbi:MAG: TetR/AcrR family transcriptional regulator [Treponema sp.]|nr:TetR/AcrR family transcriptional regulator [Treponema sp.]